MAYRWAAQRFGDKQGRAAPGFTGPNEDSVTWDLTSLQTVIGNGVAGAVTETDERSVRHQAGLFTLPMPMAT